MAVFTLWLFKCQIDNGRSAVSGEEPNETVELRLRRFSRKQTTLEETTLADQPIQVAKDVFPLPLHEFKADPAKYQIHLKQLLFSNRISADVSKMVVEEILRYVSERGTGGRDKERSLHVVTEVNGIIELKWTAVDITKEEEEEEQDQDPLENEKSEICCICLDELNGGKREEIQTPCGHVYHDLCIYHWLIDNNTCPLCRASLN